METEATIKTSVDQKVDQIKAILYLLQTHTEEFKAEIDKAYALLKVGEKTDLSNKIEKIMDDPFSNIFEISSGVDNQAKELIDRLAKSFFNFNNEIIRYAYRTRTFFNDLHYSVVLKEDNIVNREKMFEFFEKYDLLEIADRFPVYFQFVPLELMSKIPSSEEIIVNNS